MSSPIYDDFNSWDNNASNLGEGKADGNQDESMRTPGPTTQICRNLHKESVHKSIPSVSTNQELGNNANQNGGLEVDATILQQAKQDLLDIENKVCNSPTHILSISFIVSNKH